MILGRMIPGRTIRRIDLRGVPTADASPDYRTVVPRAEFDVEAALEVVRPICDAVRHRGVEAILEYSRQFDKVTQDDIVGGAEQSTRGSRSRGACRPGGVDQPAARHL